MSQTPKEAIDAGIVLMRMAGQRDNIELKITHQVLRVRAAGGTWRTVGTALGTSGQAAWERYSIAGQRSSQARTIDQPSLLDLDAANDTVEQHYHEAEVDGDQDAQNN